MRAALCAALLALFVAPALPALAQDAPAGDVDRGRKQYIDYGCWQCHGTTGAGGGWQGPKLAPNPLPYVAFATQVRKPRAQMPRYAAHLLNEQDMADIHAYLRSIPVGRPASEIETLRR